MSDPFRIQGPALISFSGGRTSGYMLWRILQAYGGVLPADVIVAFANTGKEREETLRFVHECATRWSVRLNWLQRVEDEVGFEHVGFNSAARLGEPFEELITKKGYVPNRGAQFCSIELKGRVIRDFCKQEIGWNRWTSALGLRADEGLRVFGALARNDSGKDPWRNVMPLATAGISRRDVLTFWLGPTMQMDSGDRPQGFDLGLWDYEGNCDLCWKKSDSKIMRVIRDAPERAAWWIEQEARTVSAFQTPSLTELARAVAQQPMFPVFEDDEDHDAECGLICAGDE